MKEFGSDFHFISPQTYSGKGLGDYYPDAVYYADGRQALIDLYRQNGWKRLWVPEYFCYEVLRSVEREGIHLKFYLDYPLFDECATLHSLPFEKGDVLLRVNYFGLRARRSNQDLPVPVIEDHTHDLIGDWAINSDADWCIASLRKSLPLAEGGFLWSPKGGIIKTSPKSTSENESLAYMRWRAMRTKTMFLNDLIADKRAFRADFVSTEERFDELRISAIDVESSNYIKQFDVAQWYKKKRANWNILKRKMEGNLSNTVLEPECTVCTPFSFTLLFGSVTERNDFRESLIHQSVYPAILWKVPENISSRVVDFSERVLSIHCDARYSKEDMIQLADIMVGR